MNIQIPHHQLNTLCKKNAITFLGLFGSYARNEATQDSDIDLLVDFNQTKSLFELARIKFSLEKIFNNEVDLVLRNSLKEKLKPYILKDLQTLYEKND